MVADGSDIVDYVYNHISTLCPINVKESLGERLKTLISSICSDENKLDIEGVKGIMRENFDLAQYKTNKDQRNLIFGIEVILKAAIVFYLSCRPEYIFDKLCTAEEILLQYPSFVNETVDAVEIQYLLAFRNMMKIAIEIIPPRGNKKLLMNICSTLEESGRNYPTGGSQSLATSRRVLIYEQESHTKPSKRGNVPIVVKQRTKRTTVCRCGSLILTRTMWKHKKSKKHLSYVREIESASNFRTDETVPTNN